MQTDRKRRHSPIRLLGLIPFITAAAVMTFSSVAASPAQAQFGMSEKDELQAGREADAQIRAKYRISTNRSMNGMVNHLGTRLARVSERPDIPWTFRVIESKELNAFSVPGYVYVNSGLIDAVGDDQDALAGVIGHEIGHTTGKHAVKQTKESTIGSIIVGLIGGRNRTVQSLAGLGANLVLLGHSRGDEYDADKRGIRYTIKAGYDPNGLIRFFDTLQRKGGSGGGGLATYFQTHPATGDRIKRAKDEIRKETGNSDNDSRDSRSDRTYRNNRDYRDRGYRDDGSRP